MSSVRIKSANIMYLAISLKALYVITSDKQVLRWMLSENDVVREPKRDSLNELIIRGGNPIQQRPEKVFCDTNGWHALVTFNTDDTHYFHLSTNQSLLISKLHGYRIFCVGWGKNTERYLTKELLIGTASGVIFELSIEYDSNTDTIKQVITKVFDIGKPIFGIEYIVFTGLPCKICIIVACTNHLYQFIGVPNEQGKPGFIDIFIEYKKNPTLLQSAVMEFGGSISKSQLQIYFSHYMPECFAWMNAVGVCLGNLPSSASEKLFVDQLTPLQNPKPNDNLIGVGVTKHHVYFFAPFAITIVAKINQKVVHTIDFEKRQGYEIVGVTFDQQSHSFFVWSFRFIYQIVVEHEEKDVWKYYVDRNLYLDAINFCETIISPETNKVRGMYGDYLMSLARCMEAAEVYVESDKKFEEIVLKMIPNPKALKKFLEIKLARTPAEMKSQRTLLSTWLLEIYIDIINSTYIAGDENFSNAEEQLQRFLEKYQPDLDEETTCDILQSHGRIDDWVFFADLAKKHEMVILHHINQSEFKKALVKLEQVDPNGKEVLLYKYAPVFIKSEPKRVVDMIMQVAKVKKGNIDYKKLIPALMNVENTSRDEALKLEYFLILDMKVKDKSINNLYLFHLSENEGEKNLINYLKYQETLPETTFDSDYALTLLKRNNKIESLIYLYSLVKMHTEAVNLALEYKKIDLAKQNAKKPGIYEEELSRKLWLRIAIHHIDMNNVREALSVMNESKLIKMEDLLPYFNEQDSISNFKDDICKALNSYKARIDELKSELSESKNSSEQVKRELKTIKERCIEIEGMHPCEICSKAVMKSPFYVFPCAHAFHRECLLELIMPSFKVKDVVRYQKITSALEDIADKEGRGGRKLSNSDGPKEGIRELYRKLNSFLAPQCYFCSANFIETIYDDLIEDQDEENMWSIPENEDD